MEEKQNLPETSANSAPLVPRYNIFLIVCLILVLLVVGLASVCTILAYQNYLLKKGSLNITPSSLVTQPKVTETPTASPPATIAEATKEPEIVSLDKTWNQYTNYKLCFSLKVPKRARGDDRCEWSTKDGDHSYRPTTPELVDTKIFEDQKDVFVTLSYQYRLTGETVENNRHYYSDCQKIYSSIETAEKDPFPHWYIKTRKINNDQELETFIKSNYGAGCQLGEKKPSKQAGVFDVEIKGDGKDLDQTACPLNFMYVLKYAPLKNLVFNWNMGQSSAFVDLNNKDYDSEMLASFKIL